MRITHVIIHVNLFMSFSLYTPTLLAKIVITQRVPSTSNA